MGMYDCYDLWMYLGFHWWDFPGTSYFAVSTHVLHMGKFRRDRSVIKDIVFGEQSSVSTVPKLLLEAFY